MFFKKYAKVKPPVEPEWNMFMYADALLYADRQNGNPLETDTINNVFTKFLTLF